MKRTGIVRNDIFIEHLKGMDHPEHPVRLMSIYKRLDRDGLTGQTILMPDRPATREEICWVHSESYYDLLSHTRNAKPFSFDADTWVTGKSFDAAILAAGGGIELVEQIMQEKLDNGFALVRPPGHHALHDRGMGFCILNNVAIAAEYLIRKHGLKRIAIIDFDVHHGNGTEEHFYERSDVLYVSTHQFPFYPGTGGPRDFGQKEGEGFTINLPLPQGQENCDYILAYEKFLLPIVEEYKPEFILVSAGFDTHVKDQLAGMRLSTPAIMQIVEDIDYTAQKICKGRMAMFLEGGYDPQVLADCVSESIHILLGKGRTTRLTECRMETSNARRFLKHVQVELQKYWQCITKVDGLGD